MKTRKTIQQYLAAIVGTCAISYSADTALAQTFTELWRHSYNSGSGTSTLDTARAVTFDASGSVITVGSGFQQGGTATRAVTQKVDACTGEVLWTQVNTVQTDGNAENAVVKVDSAGNVFVAGYVTSGADREVYIAKLNGASGAILWERYLEESAFVFTGQTDEFINCLTLDPAGDPLIAGGGGAGTTGETGRTWIIAKFSSNLTGSTSGGDLWSEKINNTRATPTAIVTDAAGNAYVCGNIKSAGNERDAAVFRFNAIDGSIPSGWPNLKPSPGSNRDNLWQNMTISASDEIFAVGHAEIDSNEDTRGVVRKISTSGGTLTEQILANLLDYPGGSVFSSVALHGSDVFVVGAALKANTGNGTGGNTDALFVKVPAATLEYTQGVVTTLTTAGLSEAGTTLRNRALSVAVNSVGIPFVTGESKLTVAAGYDIFLHQVDPATGLVTWSPPVFDGTAAGNDRGVSVATFSTTSVAVAGYTQETATGQDWLTAKFGLESECAACCCCTPPDANNDAFNLGLERPTFPLQLNVLANDTDPGSLPMTIVNVFPPELATISPNGLSLQFTPDADFNGTASVWYEVSNGSCSSWAVATVHFDNTAPTAVNDYITRFGYTANTVIDVEAWKNDQDTPFDMARLKIISFIQPLTGTVVLDTVGNRLRFTCNNGFTGQENFIYTVSDGFGGTSSARVFIRARGKVIWVGEVFNPISGARELVKLDASATGDATGEATWEGQTYRFKAKWVTNRYEPVTIKRGGELSPLTITLDLSDGTLNATVDDGSRQSTGLLDVATTNQTPGYYTFTIDPPGTAAPALRGRGYGGLTVKANGTFTVVGGLSDGKKFTANGVVTNNSSALFYTPNVVYNNALPTTARGSILGQFNIPQTGTQLTGTLIWSKPPQSANGIPLTALSNVVMLAEGELYTVPAPGQLPLDFTNNMIPGPSVFEFDVAPSFTHFTLSPTMLSPGTFPTGSFSPTVFPPGLKMAIKYNKKSGFFSGNGSSAPASTFGVHFTVGGVLIQGPINKGIGTAFNNPLVGSGLFEILPQ